MNRMALAALVCCIPLMTSLNVASASEHRSRAVAREFQREHPCPSTGLTSGPCPGYWRDHIVPLACGGPDVVSNMPVADDRRRAGQGHVGAEDLRSISSVPRDNRCSFSVPRSAFWRAKDAFSPAL